MNRVKYLIEVVVALDEDEKLARVGYEICRQIEKICVVHTAEVASTVAQDLRVRNR